jgi:ACR3 family arsenite transporter
MASEACITKKAKGLSIFEKYLTVWVLLCIGGGILLGKVAPGVATTLDGLAISVNGAPIVSIPIAICLFLMMYPIMVKIDFGEVIQAGKSIKPVSLTLVLNWCIKPFTMYAIALLFLGTLFYGFIGPEAVDLVKMPLGATELAVGDTYGSGTVVMHEGAKMLEVPLWRSYLAGCILLGIAPCTAMVLVWGYLAKGNDGHTLVMVAINSLTMLFLYGPLGGFLLGYAIPVPWQALLLSIGIYVALPLGAGYLSRKLILKAKGQAWFEEKFLHVLTPITIIALLATLVLLFSFKGETILAEPLTILWIAIPLTIQTLLIFGLGYGASKLLKLSYEDAAPTAMIGASNHFEVAIATATMLFGLSSGAALATVVGVLIEVPLMLALVKICLKTRGWFGSTSTMATHELQV